MAGLCCQLELHEHHVIAHTERQGEWGAAGQEVTDLQTEKKKKRDAILKCAFSKEKKKHRVARELKKEAPCDVILSRKPY